jgi:hypothetical protein
MTRCEEDSELRELCKDRINGAFQREQPGAVVESIYSSYIYVIRLALDIVNTVSKECLLLLESAARSLIGTPPQPTSNANRDDHH